MKNPYDVLGVSPNASDEEIKAAYKALARKYQEDNYNDHPLRDIAGRKMDEINGAYDEIIMQRSAGSSSYSESSYNKNNSYYEYQNSTYYSNVSDYSDVREKINRNRIDDAETILDGIPVSARNAEWHFLKGTVQYKRGWLEESVKNMRIATELDPNNEEYRSAYQQINTPHSNYRTVNTNSGCSGCDLCSGLLCADCCCECFGGDIIPCC